MVLCYLNANLCFIQKSNISLLIKLSSFKDIWIFNCTEGCQFNIATHGFKINNLSKIILTNLHINNISGLLGLLSSLNLIGRTKSLHLYGPVDLRYYLDLGKKYSRTNFNYVIYLHVLKTGLIINHYDYRIYALYCQSSFEFIFIKSERYGTFFLDKARYNYLVPGPLYGKLKKGMSFLLPDGFIMNGTSLTSRNNLGFHLNCFTDNFYRRKVFENVSNTNVLLVL
uniref:Ribonuclease Z n=1 Tax=Laurenciella marilzae TaxID=1413812 RepID=A0A1Z1M1G9_9FLOR|nr:ribonuclease Z [Laurenciella marilzae]ARW59711.1 ribonuclease Z [Laurenciella marilzae]